MDPTVRVRYRENPNFIQRFGRSLGGVFLGLVLLAAGCGLLFWNEGRAVQTARSLEEGLRKVIELPDSEGAQRGNPLVHVTAPIFTNTDLHDEVFDVTVRAVHLKRNVEVFQWVEHRTTREINEGSRTREETEFSYTQEWKSELIDSRGFEKIRENPTAFPVEPRQLRAHKVTARGFYLSDNLINQINDFQRFEVEEVVPGYQRRDAYIYRSSSDPSNPKVGDVRIWFEVAGRVTADAKVSIIAEQDHERLKAHQTDAGDVIEMLSMGDLSASQMFAAKHWDNTMMTWGLRLAGWFVLFLALSILTGPIQTLVDWLPLVRDLVALGLGIMNFSLSCTLSLFIIALGWIRYRPLLGWSLLLLGLSPYVLAKWRRRQGRSMDHYD